MGFCHGQVRRMTRACRGLARGWAGCGHQLQLHLAGSWMIQGVDRLDNSTHLNTQSTRPIWLKCPLVCPDVASLFSWLNALTLKQCSMAERVSSRQATPARYANQHTRPPATQFILNRRLCTELPRATVPIHRRPPHPPYRRAGWSRCPAQGHHVRRRGCRCQIHATNHLSRTLPIQHPVPVSTY
jgi:hypothetical protein